MPDIKSTADIKVVIDFEPVIVNKLSGFYTFGTGLLKGFSRLEEKPRLILFYSKRPASETREIEQKTTVLKMRWLEGFWKHFNYPKLEYFTGDFDVYHCLHHLMPPTRNKPRLMTIHDLRRYKLPQLYPKSKLGLFEDAVKRADHFLAVSQSTKKDLCSIFHIEEKKVDVISHATEIEPFEYTGEQKRRIISDLSGKLGQQIDNYFVAISSPDSRKNIPRIVEAFEAAQKSLPQHFKLVVIGQLPKREQEFAEKLKAGFYRDVLWAGTVEDLRPWLGCARALIFASLYEGFGIPILEAFACGTAVITSNCSSMPEVGGEAVLYVDPFDKESMAGAIVKISSGETLRQNLIKAGRERNKQFTWQKTAQAVVKVYRKLAGF